MKLILVGERLGWNVGRMKDEAIKEAGVNGMKGWDELG